MLNVILSKANIYGKHARIAYACIAGITGFSERHPIRLVKSLIFERRLLRVDKRVGSVSKVEMTTPMALIYKVLFPSISTFEAPPNTRKPEN